MNSDPLDTFLGMRKGQIAIFLVIIFAMGALVNAATLAYSINTTRAVAVENLRINCSLGKYVDSRVRDTEDLIKNFTANSAIAATLQARLESDKELAKIYANLDCPPRTHKK